MGSVIDTGRKEGVGIDSIVPETIINELAQLDRLFRQQSKSESGSVPLYSENAYHAPLSTNEGDEKTVNNPDLPTLEEKNHTEANFLSSSSRRAAQEKAFITDHCS